MSFSPPPPSNYTIDVSPDVIRGFTSVSFNGSSPAKSWIEAEESSSVETDINATTQVAEEWFVEYDKDGDGVVTASELKHMMDGQGLFHDEGTLELMFRAIDVDNSGSVTKTEFMTWLWEGKPCKIYFAADDIWTIAFLATSFYCIGGLLFTCLKLKNAIEYPPDVVNMEYVVGWIANVFYSLGGMLFFSIPLAVVQSRHKALETALQQFRTKVKNTAKIRIQNSSSRQGPYHAQHQETSDTQQSSTHQKTSYINVGGGVAYKNRGVGEENRGEELVKWL